MFAIVTAAVVVGYGAAGGNLSTLGDGETAFALEVAGNDPATSTVVPSTSASTTSTSRPTSSTEVAGPEIDPAAAVAGLSAALSHAEPETTTTTEAPSTTTAPETTTTEAPTTEAADASTSEAEPETTGTTANGDGWVDAGHGVLVPPVLLEIRYCESRDNYTAENPRSTASGAYQFLTSSWAGYGHADRYGVSTAAQATPAQQDEAALITWQASGTSPWNASSSCWG